MKFNFKDQIVKTGIYKNVLIGFGAGFLYIVFEEAFSMFGFRGPMWLLCWGTFVLNIVLIIIKSVKIKRYADPEENAPLSHFGSAAWSTTEELIADGFNVQNKGLWVAHGLFRHKQSQFMTIAGPRKGKGTNVIIPNLLIDPIGSYLVTDPKGENAIITAKWQKEAGQKVYIIDPWNEQKKLGAEHDIEPAGFNPFDFLREDIEELRDNCDMLAHYLVPTTNDAKQEFWNNRARTLIRGCLMHIVTFYPTEDHNFWTLYKMIRVSGKNLLRMFVEMKHNEECDGAVQLIAEEFLGLDLEGDIMIGALASAHKATTIFESNQIRKSLEKSDFNPYDLANGNCTVYIDIPERYLESHSVWLKMIVGLCLKAVNARPNKPVYFLIDEFPILGKMKEILDAYTYGPGQNIRMWTFAQSLSHIKNIYGEDGLNALLSTVDVLMAFGVTDPFTREFVSNSLGEGTFIKQSKSKSKSTDGSDTMSYTEGVTEDVYGRRLMTAEEVGKSDSIIVMTQRTKTRLSKYPYYIKQYENATLKDKTLPPDIVLQLKSTGQVYEWSDLFQSRACRPPRIVA